MLKVLEGMLRWPLAAEMRRRACPRCGGYLAFYFRVPMSLRQWFDGGHECRACGAYFQPRGSLGTVLAALVFVGIFGYDVAMYGAVWTVVWVEIAAGVALLYSGLVILETPAAQRVVRAWPSAARRQGPAAVVWLCAVMLLGAGRLARASHGVDAEVLVSPNPTTMLQFLAIMLPFGFIVPSMVGLWALDTWPTSLLFRRSRLPSRAEAPEDGEVSAG